MPLDRGSPFGRSGIFLGAALRGRRLRTFGRTVWAVFLVVWYLSQLIRIMSRFLEICTGGYGREADLSAPDVCSAKPIDLRSFRSGQLRRWRRIERNCRCFRSAIARGLEASGSNSLKLSLGRRQVRKKRVICVQSSDRGGSHDSTLNHIAFPMRVTYHPAPSDIPATRKDGIGPIGSNLA